MVSGNGIIRVGVVHNPRSRRNRSGRVHSPVFGHAAPDVAYAEPYSLHELKETMRHFAAQEVGLVVADGGDGTIREVLSAMVPAFGDRLPAVAVLPSGNANLIASDVGPDGSRDAALARLLEGARAGRAGSESRLRHLLRVVWPDASHATMHGMFMGCAGFTRATNFARQQVHGRGIDHKPGVALAVAAALAQAVFGSDKSTWRVGEMMNIQHAGGSVGEQRRFIFLATTLQRLVFGIWPFWNDDPATADGTLRWLDVAAPPRRLGRALPALLTGKSKPWMEAAGYRSGQGASVELTLDHPLVIDGEAFPPGPAKRVVVSAGPRVEFVLP